jgi:hypothetical protein
MRSLETYKYVIPAKAGIHLLSYPNHTSSLKILAQEMDSRLRGNDEVVVVILFKLMLNRP